MTTKRAITDALRAVARRRRAAVFPLLTVAVGCAAVLAIAGLTLMSSSKVGARLSYLEADVLLVTLNERSWSWSDVELSSALTPASSVVAVGTFSVVGGAISVRTGTTATVSAPVVVATTVGLQTRGVHVVQGAIPPPGIDELDASSILLGVSLAREIGIDVSEGKQFVWLNGIRERVTAIVDDSATQSLVATSVVITPSAAQRLGILPSSQDLLIRAAPGAASHVAERIPLLLAPDEPLDVSVSTQPSAEGLVSDITSQLDQLIAILITFVAAAGLSSIVISSNQSARERRSEVGVYLALGYSRRDVGFRFFLESMIVSALGGLVGWVLGILLLAWIARIGDEVMLLPWQVVLVGPVALAVGAVGGAFSGQRMSRLDPTELLRAAA